MGIIDKLAELLGYTKARQALAPLLQSTGEAQQYSVPSPILPFAQEELFQRLSWVYTAVTTVAETAAGAQLNVKRRVGEETEDIPNHALETLLLHPNPKDSRMELVVATAAYRALTGNAYWWLNRANARAEPAEIWVLPSHQVQPVPDGKMFLKGYLYDPGGGVQPIPLEPWEIIHFRRFHPSNWFVGLSPIESLAVVAQGDLQMQRWNTNFFGKDNAKVPGALAFADPVNDAVWERMKFDIRSQWGGVNRTGPLMLRNVGKGGVEWVTMALSQRDMEFLAGRQFTKEEILSVFAPGLASMLAINATEANARSGKATFIELSVWPLLVSIAEKLSNDLLPCYGDNLLAEFDDIRVTDREMTLREQAAFSIVHTVDEIRKEFYGDDPLEDERGDMLPAQIGPGTAMPGDEPEPVPQQLLTSGEIPPQLTAQPELEVPAEPTTDTQAQTEPDVAAAAKAALVRDLRRWQRKAIKRGKACDFESAAIPEPLRRAIKANLEQFGPDAFRFLKDAPVSRGDAEDALVPIVAGVLAAESVAIRASIMMRIEPNYEPLTTALQNALIPQLAAIATEEVLREAIEIGVEFDIAEINAAALEWARTYTYDLVTGLVDTTKRAVSAAVQQFISTPGMTEGDLEALLEPAFGSVRAQMIGITEITRAYSQAASVYQELLAKAGVRMRRVWRSAADERRCPVCGELDGEDEETWADMFNDGPPAHVNCVLPGQIVAVPGLSVAAKSLYRGRVIQIGTAHGRILAVTENHPVLTTRGWVVAQFVHQGDDVLTHGRPERIASAIYPDYDHRPTKIEQVFRSLRVAHGMMTTGVPVSSEDLHGDGGSVHGNIEIVRPDRELLRDIHAIGAEPFGQFGLNRDDVRQGASAPNGMTMLLGVRDDAPTSSSMGSLGQLCPACGRELLHASVHTLGAIAARYAVRSEDAPNDKAAHAAIMGQLLLGDAGQIAANQRAFVRHGSSALELGTAVIPAGHAGALEGRKDNIPAYAQLSSRFLERESASIEPDRVTWIGESWLTTHVYDLQSELAGVYTCNGILVKNCRCWLTLELER